MSYISPIKIEEIPQMEEGWADKIGKYIAGEVDNLVLESCVKVGCHVDKGELEKALRYDRDQYARGYADGKRDAAPTWHSVEDGLPEIGKRVLVSYGGDVQILKCTDNMTYDGKNYWWNEADGLWERVEESSYWMPIEPPKEE